MKASGEKVPANSWCSQTLDPYKKPEQQGLVRGKTPQESMPTFQQSVNKQTPAI